MKEWGHDIWNCYNKWAQKYLNGLMLLSLITFK